MTRRKFSREFKIEAVRLVTDRGAAVAQAARVLDVGESVVRRWMRELAAKRSLRRQADPLLEVLHEHRNRPAATAQHQHAEDRGFGRGKIETHGNRSETGEGDVRPLWHGGEPFGQMIAEKLPAFRAHAKPVTGGGHDRRGGSEDVGIKGEDHRLAPVGREAADQARQMPCSAWSSVWGILSSDREGRIRWDASDSDALVQERGGRHS